VIGFAVAFFVGIEGFFVVGGRGAVDSCVALGIEIHVRGIIKTLPLIVVKVAVSLSRHCRYCSAK
jgi:hypothetical protein